MSANRIMIREFEASEFIAMIALKELQEGHNSLEISIEDLVDCAKRLEKNNVNIRINLSTTSLISFFCRTPDSISIQRGILMFRDIEDDYIFLRRYASEESLSRIIL